LGQVILLQYIPLVSAKLQLLFVGGQSNCQGLGDKFHLLDLIETADAEFSAYGPVNGADIVGREDVYAWIQGWGRTTNGALTARFGDTKQFFGGEVGTGYVLGDYFATDPVLIVKHCEVGPLAEDWRPPASGDTTGAAYLGAMETFRTAQENPGDYYPAYDGSGVDLLGFVWWHGYADAYENDFRTEYESNLANLLDNVAAEFPTLPGQIIVELGGGGSSPDGQEAEMREIQRRVATQNPATLFVETSPFSGGEPHNDETYVHYGGRADNYIRIGEAIGNAVVALNGETTVAPTAQPTAAPTTAAPTTAAPTTAAPTTAAPTTPSPSVRLPTSDAPVYSRPFPEFPAKGRTGGMGMSFQGMGGKMWKRKGGSMMMMMMDETRTVFGMKGRTGGMGMSFQGMGGKMWKRKGGSMMMMMMDETRTVFGMKGKHVR
jgi:hypothetical protein